MNKEHILKVIEDEGMFWTHKLSDEDYEYIIKLEEENIIESIRSAGLDFMNGDYCYIKKGNPHNVYVKTVRNESWVTK